MGVKFGLFHIKEEYKLRLFESRGLRMICGPKWGDVRRQYQTAF